MVSPTTPWFVWFQTYCKDDWITLQLFSRSTVVPSCLLLFFCTWSNQSWLFPRSLNMSTTSSRGGFSFGILCDRDINHIMDLSKKGETTWQIGWSPHCAGLSDLSIPRRLGGGTFSQCWRRHDICQQQKNYATRSFGAKKSGDKVEIRIFANLQRKCVSVGLNKYHLWCWPAPISPPPAKSDSAFWFLSQGCPTLSFNVNQLNHSYFSSRSIRWSLLFIPIRMAGGQNVGFQNSTFLSER